MKMGANMSIDNVAYGAYRHIERHAERSGTNKPHNPDINYDLTEYNIHLSRSNDALATDDGPSKYMQTNSLGSASATIKRHFSSDLKRVNTQRQAKGKEPYKNVYDYVRGSKRLKVESDAIMMFGEQSKIEELKDKLYAETTRKNGRMNRDDFEKKFAQAASNGLANYAKSFNKRNKYLTLTSAITNVDESSPHLHMQIIHTGFNKYDKDGNPAEGSHASLTLNDALKGQYPGMDRTKAFTQWRSDETDYMLTCVGKSLNKEFGLEKQWQKADLKGRSVFVDKVDDFKKMKKLGINVEELEHTTDQLSQTNEMLSRENDKLKERNQDVVDEKNKELRRRKAMEMKYDKLKQRADRKDEINNELKAKNAKLKSQLDKKDNRNKYLYEQNKSLTSDRDNAIKEKDKYKKENERLQRKLNLMDNDRHSHELDQYKDSVQAVFNALNIDVDPSDPEAMRMFATKYQKQAQTRPQTSNMSSQTQSEAPQIKRAPVENKQPQTRVNRPQMQSQTRDIKSPDPLSLFDHITVESAIKQLGNMFQMYCAQFAKRLGERVTYTANLDRDLLYGNKPVTFDLDGKKQQMDPRFVHDNGSILYGVSAKEQSNYWGKNMPQDQQSQWQYDEEQLKAGHKLTWAQILQERREYKHLKQSQNTYGIGASIKGINNRIKEWAHDVIGNQSQAVLDDRDTIEPRTDREMTPEEEGAMSHLYDCGVDNIDVTKIEHPYGENGKPHVIDYELPHKGLCAKYDKCFKYFGFQDTQAEFDYFTKAHEGDWDRMSEHINDRDAIESDVIEYITHYDPDSKCAVFASTRQQEQATDNDRWSGPDISYEQSQQFNKRDSQRLVKAADHLPRKHKQKTKEDDLEL